jgi:D-glycerate 3-kinase
MSPPPILPILHDLANGLLTHEGELQLIADLASSSTAKAFGVTPQNVEAVVKEQTPIFRAVAPDVLSLLAFSDPQATLATLWTFWLPLAIQLAALRQQLARPLIQGILGGQGTGKTTSALVLSLILAHFGYRTLALSLDDLYKTYAERQRLQQEDPRLIWRGPPGTHDVELGRQILAQLRLPNLAEPVSVPRFDKSAHQGIGDRALPEQVDNVDVVLFEGWFVGVRPIEAAVFEANTPAPINTNSDRAFAREINDKLRDYLPLWDCLDRLLILYPIDYRLSKQWRRQAEQEMIARGKAGMTDAQVDEFVEYFWRSLHPELFITPLTKNPNLVDLVVEINPDHGFGKIYRPGAI